MPTFNDDCFGIGSRIDVDTPSEPMLKPFYVVVKAYP